MGGIASCMALTVCECACCCACGCLKSVFNATMAQVTRLAHVFILISLFVFAIILGQSHPNDLNEYNEFSGLNLEEGCNENYTSECIYRQLIYRASFVLFLLFFFLAVGNVFSEQVNRSFWVVKFAFAFCVFFGLWWGDNSFFSGWSQFSRIFSFFWLLVQAILFLDFAYDLHEVIMFQDSEAEGSKKWRIFYLVLGAGFIALSMTGIGYLYADYSDCGVGSFFTSVCLIFGVVGIAISMLDRVSRGFLPPCIMFAYSTFLVWYALLSSPDDGCNPDANTNDGMCACAFIYTWIKLRFLKYKIGEKENAMIIISCLTFVILLYCAINGTKILNIFNPEGEGVMISQLGKGTLGAELTEKAEEGRASATTSTKVPTDSPGSSEGEDDTYTGGSNFVNESSGTVHERVFFHVLMMLTSCYCAMLFTNWGRANGLPEGLGSSQDEANTSMWLKILSQWTFLAMQGRVLWLAYRDNEN